MDETFFVRAIIHRRSRVYPVPPEHREKNQNLSVHLKSCMVPEGRSSVNEFR